MQSLGFCKYLLLLFTLPDTYTDYEASGESSLIIGIDSIGII